MVEAHFQREGEIVNDDQFEWFSGQLVMIRMALNSLRTIATIWLILWVIAGIMQILGLR